LVASFCAGAVESERGFVVNHSYCFLKLGGSSAKPNGKRSRKRSTGPKRTAIRRTSRVSGICQTKEFQITGGRSDGGLTPSNAFVRPEESDDKGIRLRIPEAADLAGEEK
jgi:hypothetical protein